MKISNRIAELVGVEYPGLSNAGLRERIYRAILDADDVDAAAVAVVGIRDAVALRGDFGLRQISIELARERAT